MGKKKKKLPAGFYENSDGLLSYRFTIEGKRYAVYGSTVKECKEKELIKREEISQKIYKKGKGQTVSEYLDRWMESRELVIKSATIRTYKKLLNRIKRTEIDDAGTKFGDLKLLKVETQNVRDLQKALHKELTSRTVNDSMSLLKKAFTAAVNERILQWNPCNPIERLPRTEEQARENIHRALTPDELKAFMMAAEGYVKKDDEYVKEDDPSWYYNFYQFLLHTGMRIGEAGALYISDITGDVIQINKTVTRTESGYEIAQQTKTEAGRRTVPIRPEARKAIEDQKLQNRILDGGKLVKLNEPIFRMPKGGIIRPDRVNTDIKNICEKAGIDKFTCHAFRATFTSRCVSDGVPVKELMEILGHTDVEMTLGLYAHSNDELKMTKLLAVNI